MNQPTRVTIVAGFLGAGKTSVLRNMISASLPQRTGVLVNEVGAVGIDGDFIAAANGQLDVQELMGGCICCTALVAFKHRLVQMLRRRPERLFVEPTGLAAIGSLRDVFAEPGIAQAVELDPILVVVNPRHWQLEHIRTQELYQEQCSHADIMAVSHTDCCDDELLSSFYKAHASFPLITSKHGHLETRWDTACAEPGEARIERPRLKLSSVDGFASEAIAWSSDKVIDLGALAAIFSSYPPPDSILRCKGNVRSHLG
ncbi:MAG: hypothetical protein MK135_16195, partial [Polyangiaceae bacterium]|nr:hypothetical protein [Polyangiaceae bacterium]